MKLILRTVFFILLAYTSYQLLPAVVNHNQPAAQVLQQFAHKGLQQYLCKTPITWRIGQLDPAFDLTPEQAGQAADNAAAQWNAALGQELFRHDSNSGFPINFAYDERQQRILQQARLRRNLARYDASINQRRASLEQKIEHLKQRQHQFDQLNQQFKTDASRFEQEARQANAANRHTLQQQQQQLTSRQRQLQQLADQLNNEQQQLIRQQRDLNQTVADRNALLPQQPTITAAEVGNMQIRGRSRSMTIFAFSSLADLELTMLHEFGHALGLGHTDNAASVMYYALTSEQNGLHSADIQAVRQQCGF